MFSLEELLFSASLAVYVASSVFVAAIRWGHKCEPYARYAEYYYPGWQTLVFCYLSNVLLLPLVFMPHEADAILMVRMILILSSPFFCAAILFSYFGKMLKVHWWRKPVIALSIPFTIMATSALVFAFVPGTQLLGPFGKGFFSAAGILALIFMACFFQAIRMLSSAIQRYSQENYSNPEDFPHQFASGVLWVPIFHVLICWVSTFIGSLPVMSVALFILSSLNIVLLIMVLVPHRAKEIDQLVDGEAPLPEEVPIPVPAAPEPEKEEAVEELLLPERKKDIADAIRNFVEDKQGYLDCHLTLASLSRSIGINRSYVSAVITECFGGFFAYVNRCRLDHLAQLKKEDPALSVADLTVASGFGSRQSYYNVRKQLGE